MSSSRLQSPFKVKRFSKKIENKSSCHLFRHCLHLIAAAFFKQIGVHSSSFSSKSKHFFPVRKKNRPGGDVCARSRHVVRFKFEKQNKMADVFCCRRQTPREVRLMDLTSWRQFEQVQDLNLSARLNGSERQRCVSVTRFPVQSNVDELLVFFKKKN